MKRCPTCEKTYEDNLRFCQIDGTPLVDEIEEIDPYKTMVARPEDIRAAMPVTPEPAATDEALLELPEEPDPNKTQFVSEDELRAEMARQEEDVVELPPAVEAETAAAPDQFSMTSPPIPSPFEAKPFEAKPFEPAAIEPEAPQYAEPEPPTPQFTTPEPSSPFAQPEPPASPFAEPEPPKAEPAYNPFEHSAPAAEPMMQAEWKPPAAPESSWQNQEIGQNTPFQPPPAGAAADGQNKTMPLISLVAGILSLCCWVSPITGIIALITGFLGLKNIKNDPANYGGKGFAIAGMVIGGLFFLIGLVYWIFVVFFNGMALMMQGVQ